MRRSSRDEDGVARALRIGVAHHAVLLVEPLAQFVVQVDALVVDGVGVGLQLLALLQRHPVQHVADFVGVPRMVEVPDGADGDAGTPNSGAGQEITVRFVHGFQAELVVLVVAGKRKKKPVSFGGKKLG